MTSEQNKLSDERLADLAKFSESGIIVAISEIELHCALSELLSRRASAGGELHGPFGWMNGCWGLSEDSWTLDSDPMGNNDEYFAIPLYAKQDPFKEAGSAPAPSSAPVEGWVMVPKEPTREMWAAMGTAVTGYFNKHHDIVAGEVYAAMLASAPALHSKALPDVNEEMIDAALDAHVVGACPVLDYLDFNAADAKEMGVLIDGENFAGLDIVRHDPWRSAGRAIMRVALTAALNAAQGAK